MEKTSRSPTLHEPNVWSNPGSLGFRIWLKHADAGIAGGNAAIQRRQQVLLIPYERHASFTRDKLSRRINGVGELSTDTSLDGYEQKRGLGSVVTPNTALLLPKRSSFRDSPPLATGRGIVSKPAVKETGGTAGAGNEARDIPALSGKTAIAAKLQLSPRSAPSVPHSVESSAVFRSPNLAAFPESHSLCHALDNGKPGSTAHDPTGLVSPAPTPAGGAPGTLPMHAFIRRSLPVSTVSGPSDDNVNMSPKPIGSIGPIGRKTGFYDSPRTSTGDPVTSRLYRSARSESRSLPLYNPVATDAHRTIGGQPATVPVHFAVHRSLSVSTVSPSGPDSIAGAPSEHIVQETGSSTTSPPFARDGMTTVLYRRTRSENTMQVRHDGLPGGLPAQPFRQALSPLHPPLAIRNVTGGFPATGTSDYSSPPGWAAKPASPLSVHETKLPTGLRAPLMRARSIPGPVDISRRPGDFGPSGERYSASNPHRSSSKDDALGGVIKRKPQALDFAGNRFELSHAISGIARHPLTVATTATIPTVQTPPRQRLLQHREGRGEQSPQPRHENLALRAMSSSLQLNPISGDGYGGASIPKDRTFAGHPALPEAFRPPADTQGLSSRLALPPIASTRPIHGEDHGAQRMQRQFHPSSGTPDAIPTERSTETATRQLPGDVLAISPPRPSASLPLAMVQGSSPSLYRRVETGLATSHTIGVTAIDVTNRHYHSAGTSDTTQPQGSGVLPMASASPSALAGAADIRRRAVEGGMPLISPISTRNHLRMPRELPVRTMAAGAPASATRVQRAAGDRKSLTLTLPDQIARRSTEGTSLAAAGGEQIGITNASSASVRTLVGSKPSRIADSQWTTQSAGNHPHRIAELPLVTVQRRPSEFRPNELMRAPADTAIAPAVTHPEDRYGVVSPPGRELGEAGERSADTRSIAGSEAGMLDPEDIAEQTWRMIAERLAIEQERRGLTKWP